MTNPFDAASRDARLDPQDPSAKARLSAEAQRTGLRDAGFTRYRIGWTYTFQGDGWGLPGVFTLSLNTAPTPAPLKVVADSGSRPVSQLPQIPLQTGMKPSEFRNGYLDTEILDAIASRLEGFQGGPMACAESEEAAELIRQAVFLLRSRVPRRKAEGTYGSMTETQPVQSQDGVLLPPFLADKLSD